MRAKGKDIAGNVILTTEGGYWVETTPGNAIFVKEKK